MRIRFLVVGKPRDPEAETLLDRYVARSRQFGVTLTIRRVPEQRPGGRYSDEHVREREARSLLAEMDAKDHVVAVDPRGRSMTSEVLAERLAAWARPRSTFVVGGALGLHESVRRRADFVWSLSELTFPHELALAIVAEQVYRALTLARGVPYHK
jgi:23S rRNA (pseudouridine1915-N3)-methyltransferase